MTDELTKTFFDTFGIKPKLDCIRCGAKNFALGQCWEVDCEKSYPQITDRIYLMLLATLTCISSIEFPFSDIQKLKEDILKEVIKHQYGFDKHQVRTLFEEG